MFDDVIRLLTEQGIQRTHPILILAALRPLGLLFGFLAMNWAFGQARVLRISLALSLGIPVLVGNIGEIEALVHDAEIGRLIFIAPKEFFIGYGIGFLSSLPFLALQFAGAITDSFRGESDSGLTSPAGDRLTTFGSLYLIIGLAAFATFDGLPVLVGNLYRSYGLWPLGDIFPTFSREAATILLAILGDLLWVTLKIATPLLIFLATIEFAVSISARVARRFNFYDHAFSFKNLAAIFSLPVLAAFVWMLAEGMFEDVNGGLRLLEALFQ